MTPAYVSRLLMALLFLLCATKIDALPQEDSTDTSTSETATIEASSTSESAAPFTHVISVSPPSKTNATEGTHRFEPDTHKANVGDTIEVSSNSTQQH